MLQPFLLPEWSGKLDPLPDAVSDRPIWQYGVGTHRSSAQRILGAVLINARCDGGTAVKIWHLIIDGSSQWVVGRNVTRKCNVIYLFDNMVQLP